MIHVHVHVYFQMGKHNWIVYTCTCTCVCMYIQNFTHVCQLRGILIHYKQQTDICNTCMYTHVHVYYMIFYILQDKFKLLRLFMHIKLNT